MSEGQHEDGPFIRHMTVKGHVARLTEPDHQFTQSRLPFKRSTDLRHGFQEQKLPLDRCAGAGSGANILPRQELPAPLKAPNRTCRHDHLWHGGASGPSSVPQSRSHPRVSAPVKCCPVR